MKRKPIYGVGDKIKIVKYGHLIWENKKTDQPKLSFPLIKEDENIRWLDMSSDLVGRTDIVDKVTITQGIPKYSLVKLGAWFKEDQMEMINKNPRTEL